MEAPVLLMAGRASAVASGDANALLLLPWLCREELKKLYTKFTQDFPIVTIEDPFDQDDWDHTAAFTAEGVCQVPFPPYQHSHICCEGTQGISACLLRAASLYLTLRCLAWSMQGEMRTREPLPPNFPGKPQAV